VLACPVEQVVQIWHFAFRRKSTASFEVRELMGGKSAIAFSCRIVGRRKERHGN
jgi:hypothetical protein